MRMRQSEAVTVRSSLSRAPCIGIQKTFVSFTVPPVKVSSEILRSKTRDVTS
jgi:hypothetical protein